VNENKTSKKSRSLRWVEKENWMRVRQSSEESEGQHLPVRKRKKENLGIDF